MRTFQINKINKHKRIQVFGRHIINFRKKYRKPARRAHLTSKRYHNKRPLYLAFVINGSFNGSRLKKKKIEYRLI